VGLSRVFIGILSHYIISKLYFRVFSSLDTAPSEINVRSKNVILSERSIKTIEDERVP
jgi:hypothetical protein